MARVNIEGLNKADVLAVLHNTARPKGIGLIQVGRRQGRDLTREEAEGVISKRSMDLKFDYLAGRPLKVDLSSDVEFDPQEYDAKNGGEGTAETAIAHLRATGRVDRADGTSFDFEKMSNDESMLYAVGVLKSSKG